MFDWQSITVLLIVGAASLYVGRAIWKSIFDSSVRGCGSCNSCESSSETPPKVLVDLDDVPIDNRK